jgi:hypothetical protein
MLYYNKRRFICRASKVFYVAPLPVPPYGNGVFLCKWRLFQNSGSFERATLDVHAVFLLFIFYVNSYIVNVKILQEVFAKVTDFCKNLNV